MTQKCCRATYSLRYIVSNLQFLKQNLRVSDTKCLLQKPVDFSMFCSTVGNILFSPLAMGTAETLSTENLREVSETVYLLHCISLNTWLNSLMDLGFCCRVEVHLRGRLSRKPGHGLELLELISPARSHRVLEWGRVLAAAIGHAMTLPDPQRDLSPLLC